ncbi:hypothetical protein FDUTEX481_10114 [Tolypothrix sp. PCC 7601]|nr:hypothetical protein FDUTEX481_10114 [Tolypothrix sp. PCC 7601]
MFRLQNVIDALYVLRKLRQKTVRGYAPHNLNMALLFLFLGNDGVTTAKIASSFTKGNMEVERQRSILIIANRNTRSQIQLAKIFL